MRGSRAFTLLEVLVTLTIITIVTYLVTVAFPNIREEEALTHARQNIISALKSAQTQALDEQRSPKCLARVSGGATNAKRCSDIGILLRGQDLITFADINDNNQFDNQDFALQSAVLPRPVVTTATTSFVIEATPPNVTMWHDGVIIPAGSRATVTIRARQRTKTLSFSSYGVIDK